MNCYPDVRRSAISTRSLTRSNLKKTHARVCERARTHASGIRTHTHTVKTVPQTLYTVYTVSARDCTYCAHSLDQIQKLRVCCIFPYLHEIFTIYTKYTTAFYFYSS